MRNTPTTISSRFAPDTIIRIRVSSLDAGYVIATAKTNPLDQTLRLSLSFDMDGIKDLLHRR